jgi:hypothetical protein
MEEPVSPVFHEYVVVDVPPLTLSVADPPGQIVSEFTLIFNDELTVTVATAVPEQPLSVAVTVYEVVLVGETVIGFVVSPELHE